MKKKFILLILLASVYLARSQNLITTCEYWADNNYGASKMRRMNFFFIVKNFRFESQ